jgi:DNA polymerase-1
MKQWPILERNGLLELFHMECDLINLLVDMRFQGVTVDLGYTEELYEKFGGLSRTAQDELNSLAGFDVNTNASESLATAFNKLGLEYDYTAPTAAKPEGSPSFTADFLKTVKHPFATGVLRVKQLEKIRGTFLKSYILDGAVPLAGSNSMGKVYCSFHQMSSDGGGARTGRFSSSDPNLQNIPTRTEEGAMIRQAFVMDPGHVQVRDFDYSQIEYRMLAHYAVGPGSEELRTQYNADPKLDYHTLSGGMIAKMPGLEAYATKEKRPYVKNVNFGVVYGVGDGHMAEMLGLSLREAKELLAKIHAAVPFAKATMEAISEEVNRTGIVTTILGRMSHFDLWEPSNWQDRRGAFPLPYKAALESYGIQIMRAYLYRALNYRLQGSAAEIMKKGMVECYKRGVFAVTGVPRLTVHDELFFSDPGNVPDDAWAEMKHIMETCVPGIRVPIRFDCGVGPNWREAH